MPRIDWTEEEHTSKFVPGVYLAEVDDCEERTSQRTQAPYFNVRLKSVDHGGVLAFDILMLGGKGRNIGTAKLRALGFDEGVIEIEAHDLIGKRAYVFLHEDEYKGKRRLRVNIDQGQYCGYSDPDSAIAPAGYIGPGQLDSARSRYDPDGEPPRNMGDNNPYPAYTGKDEPDFIDADDTPF